MDKETVTFPKRMSIGWLKKMYDEDRLTPMQVIEYILDRSESYKEYNIFITPPSASLIKPYIDNLINIDRKRPLWGIPFVIKDNIDLAGVPTTAACPAYSYVPEESATVVKKLIEAGAIPVGKTNLDQFATGLVGTRSPYGECHNALREEMISGGSSSGSAVSVALGLAAFGLGTDTAGSGRVPAMLNNLIGYKPPIGSWSTKGVVPACASLDCVTVFTVNMEDAELVDMVARGFDEECIWSRKIENKPNRLPEKVYLPVNEPEFFGTWENDYRRKWHSALERIKEIGKKKKIKIEYIDYKMFYDAALILYEGAYIAERWQDLKGFVENNPGATFPVTEEILRSGAKTEQTAAKLFGNLHDLQLYRHKAHLLLKNAVMIMPTAGGSFTREQVRQEPVAANSKMGLYTNHCNLLDMAATAIPQDTKDMDKPFGITVFGRYDNEDMIRGFSNLFLDEEIVRLAVCGLHKKGRELEYQLTSIEAEFEKHAYTSENYRLYKLPTKPVKPGLVRVIEGGASIQVDVYCLTKKALGKFMADVSAPLVIGDIELEDGNIVKGFLCQEYILKEAKDITGEGTF